MIKYLYTFITLGIGTVITVLVSLACSYWFFYSLMGSGGYQSIGAGIAGCAIQLFGYGFAASFLKINKIVRVVLCSVPLALSMLSSYSALYGYLSKEKVDGLVASKKESVIFDILEQSAKDKEIAASAAKQGVGDSYRTQAKSFLEMNSETREKDEHLLIKLDEQQEQKRDASPLDGLVYVTGSSELAMILFCAWLAIMFDMLPVIAIGVISRKEEGDKSNDDVQEQGQDHDEDIDHEAQAIDDHAYAPGQETSGSEVVTDSIMVKGNVGIDDDINSSHENPSACLTECEESNDDLLLSQDEVVTEIRHGRVKPNYKHVQQITGWSQWKAQEFFKHCQEIGVLEKHGRSFKVVNNLTVIGQSKKAVNL